MFNRNGILAYFSLALSQLNHVNKREQGVLSIGQLKNLQSLHIGFNVFVS